VDSGLIPVESTRVHWILVIPAGICRASKSTEFIERYEFLHCMMPPSEQSKKTKKSHNVAGLTCDNNETDSEYEGDE
jgi:hypothetical protein